MQQVPQNQVYGKKSRPTIPLGGSGPAEKLDWLAYPQSVLNKVTAEEELTSIKYNPEGKATKLAASEYVDSDPEEEEDGWETMSESDESGDWEEQLVYVELNDVPSIQELFAVQPDDFQRFLRKRYRQRSQPVKDTHPKVTCHFHQFQSSSPILQIGNRYFHCRWEEPTGTAMFFRKTGNNTSNSTGPSKSGKIDSCSTSTLNSIFPEPSIPWDDIFGTEHHSSKNAYEVVALADKVLKTEQLEADSKKMNKIPTNRQFFGTPGTCKFKVPQGYTATDLLAGEYRPKRTYARKSKLRPMPPGQAASSDLPTSEKLE